MSWGFVQGQPFTVSHISPWQDAIGLKAFWLIAVGASMYFCVMSAQSIFLPWKESPLTMQMMDTKTPISAIPFPTISICMDAKANTTMLNIPKVKKTLIESPEKLSEFERKKVHALAHVCPQMLPENYDLLDEKFSDDSIYNVMQAISPRIDMSMTACKWKQERVDCNKIFNEQFTGKGLCFTFNALNSHDIYTDKVARPMMATAKQANVSGWSIESGYASKANGDEYPWRVFDVERNGLAFSIRVSKNDLEPVCQDIYTGFTVYLHTPGDTISQTSVHNVLSKGVNIRIKPTLIDTSKGLQDYPLSARQCYLNFERRLHFFKYYTLSNCETECLANYTRQQCGCVKFSMPRDNQTKICGVANIACYREAEHKLFGEDLISGLTDPNAKIFRTNCRCLPPCTSIKYDLEVTHFAVTKTNFPNSELGNVTIFLGNREVDRIQRSEKYSVADLLSISGNLLGLFLGVSALSIIELVYYFTLRLFWSLRQLETHDIRIVKPFDSKDEIVNSNDGNGNLKQLMRDEALNFCSETSIQGISFITERRRHWSERIFWIVIVALALWQCGESIRNVLSEWKDHPVKVAFEDKTARLETIPRPTITLCPDVKARPSDFNLTHVIAILQGSEGNLTLIDRQYIEALAHICPNLLSAVTSSKNYQFHQKLAEESIHDTIWSTSTVVSFLYGPNNLLIDPSDVGGHISKIWTEYGVCYSINAMNSRDVYTEEMSKYTMNIQKRPSASNWTLEGGYTDNNILTAYPSPALDHRLHTDSIKLHSRYGETNNLCQNDIAGFKVFLNIPGEIPSSVQSEKLYTHTSFRQSLDLSLTAYVIRTTEVLRKYAPNTRNCYFASERNLRFFKMYTKHNCQLECLANFLKQKCGCVKLSMPRDNITPICGVASIPCYRSAEAILFDDHGIDSKEHQLAKVFRERCNCLEPCTSIVYEETTFQSEIPQDFLFYLTFNIGPLKTLLQSERYTIAEFLSICGGLLGLFLGVSALSIIELFYHFTLRLFWTIRHRMNRNEFSSAHATSSQSLNRTLLQTLADLTSEFCSITTIHGVRYFTERQRHWSERTFWCIIVGLSLYFGGKSIMDMVFRWQQNPVKISLSDGPTPVSTIPFPTVVICPEAKANQRKMNVNKVLTVLRNTPEKLTQTELSQLNTLAFFCPQVNKQSKRMHFGENFTDSSIYDDFRDLAHPIRHLMFSCSWKHIDKDCETLFTPIFTEKGQCYAFNSLNSRDIYTDEVSDDMMNMVNSKSNISGWSLENGYTHQGQTKNETYPIRAFSSFKNSLQITLNRIKTTDAFCSSLLNVMTISVSLPGEDILPLFLRTVKVSRLARGKITITPRVITTSKGLRSYDPQTRQCFFGGERQLRFYKTYTKYNCETECLSNFTKQECGCVPFYMPRDNDTKICGVEKQECCRQAQSIPFGLDITMKGARYGQLLFMNCDCLAPCNWIQYELFVDRTGDNVRMSSLSNAKYQSAASIHFKDYEFVTLTRSEMYTAADFLVLCGGLLGLLLGVSVLSAMELIYYPSLRLYWMIRKRKPVNKQPILILRTRLSVISILAKGPSQSSAHTK